MITWKGYVCLLPCSCVVAKIRQMADELYPDTGDDIVKAEPGGEDGADFEEMLKRELEGMSVDRKSSRFREVQIQALEPN